MHGWIIQSSARNIIGSLFQSKFFQWANQIAFQSNYVKDFILLITINQPFLSKLSFPCLTPNDLTKYFQQRAFFPLKCNLTTEIGDNFYLKT
jgi:hypothetical protein